MLVRIAHPVWVYGTPKRHRTLHCMNFRSSTDVMIDEVTAADTDVAFQITERGKSFDLLARKNAPNETGAWWPVSAADGHHLAADEWAAGVAMDNDLYKRESGFCDVLDTPGHWPEASADEIDDCRNIERNFQDDNRATVQRAAVNLMIVDGHVWRLIDDPVYFVDPLPSLPGSDPRVHVLSQRKEAEKFASFSQFDPPAPMPDRLVPARSAHEWMASTSPMVSAARFRADDKAEAELYAKQMGHLAFEANIDVRRPERVLATPAALQMKVAAIGFARMFDAQGRQALWGYPAASVADIIDAAKRIVETKKSSAMPAKSDVGLILAFEVGDGEHAKMRDKRDWWLRRLKVSIERVERDTSRGHSTKSFSPDDERSLVALGAA